MPWYFVPPFFDTKFATLVWLLNVPYSSSGKPADISRCSMVRKRSVERTYHGPVCKELSSCHLRLLPARSFRKTFESSLTLAGIMKLRITPASAIAEDNATITASQETANPLSHSQRFNTKSTPIRKSMRSYQKATLTTEDHHGHPTATLCGSL
jgi:hypothetical protein